MNLSVFGSAMRAFPQFFHPFPARAAKESRPGMAEIAQKKDQNEERKENVADSWTQCGQREEEIAENAATQQGNEIENRLSNRQLAEDFVYRGYCQHEKHPDRAQKEAQDERKPERVERGVVVIEHPSFWHIMLDSCIEKGGKRQRDEQIGGVGREDVAKEENVGFPLAKHLPEQDYQRNEEDNQEDAEVANAEEMDELRDGIVGHNALLKVALMCPAHCELVASEFHPNAIHRIFWNDKCLSHNKLVVVIDRQLLAQCIDREVVEWLTALQGKAVHAEFEVVPDLVERGIFLPIVAGREEKDGSHQNSPKGGFMDFRFTHYSIMPVQGPALSSRTSCSRTRGGIAFHPPAQGRAGLSIPHFLFSHFPSCIVPKRGGGRSGRA